jgi:predicted Zn-dependent peptidase
MSKKHIYKLKNGIKVLIVPIDTKLTSVSVSIKLGDTHENKDEVGITHYMEHLMARMTSKKYPDEKYVSQELSKRGAFVNAYVNEYETKFYIKGMFKDVAFYLDVLANAIFNFYLISEIAEKEKYSIIHELQENMSANSYIFEYKIKQYLYQKYSYHYDYQKYINVLKKYDINKIADFINKHIDVKNTTVSVSCPLDGVIQTKHLVKTYFENITQKHNVKLQYPSLTNPNKGLKIIQVQNPKKDKNTMLIVHVDKPIKYLSEEYLCLMIFEKILCSFETGILYKILRKQYGLIYSVNMQRDINFHNYKMSSYSIETATDCKNVPLFIYHLLNTMRDYTFNDEQVENARNSIYIDIENKKFYTLTSQNDMYEKFLLHNKPIADEGNEILRKFKTMKMSYIKKMIRRFQREILETGIIFYYSNKNVNRFIHKQIENKTGPHYKYKLLSI